MATRCTAKTAKGTACRAWAVRGSDPPRCAAHGGGSRPPGAPRGNTNARRHGAYQDDGSSDLADVLARMNRHLQYLEQCIQDYDGEDPEVLPRLLVMHSQAAARLARFLERQGGAEHDELMAAIDAAMDEAAEIMGVDI